MAIVYNATIKNARMEIVRAAIDAGAGPGLIKLYDSTGGTLLVNVPFEDPCAPPVTAAVLTFDMPVVEPIALASGTAAQATLTTSAGAVVADGLTVGTVGTDVLLNSVVVTEGEPVTILSASIVHG